MTIVDLKARCKANNVKGYSAINSMNKTEWEEKCKFKTKKSPNIVDLKARCKANNVKGYSAINSTNKTDWEEKCNVKMKKSPNIVEVKAQCKANNIKGYSAINSTNKADWELKCKNKLFWATLTDMTETSPNKISKKHPLLHNRRNSCYIDSVLVALFHDKNNKLVTSMFLEKIFSLCKKQSQFVYGTTDEQDLKMRQHIQKTLIKIVKQIRGGYCDGDVNEVSNLRTLLGKCRFLTKFDAGAQEDASDFMAVLCQVFNVHDKQNEQQMQVMGTHDLVNTPPENMTLTTDVNNDIGLMYHVFDWKPGCFIHNTLVSHKLDSGRVEPFSKHHYVRAITTTEFKPKLFFVVHVDRTTTGIHTNRSRIFVDSLININKRKFKLLSIVLHIGSTIKGGHYISLILSDGIWFVFDDTQQSLKVSKYTKYEIAEKCVLVFYSV